MIKAYYLLTKPGIVYSNVLAAIAGFFLAEKGVFDVWLFFSMVFGIGFVIASACVFNNIMDQGIDSKMSRTLNRALITKKISEFHAAIFATMLGFVGFFLLLINTNLLTSVIAFTGFIFYVVVYGIFKRKSVHGTIIGSISGAVPPVVGYCAVTNNFDLAALLLFLILVIWQMPHFYSIAIFRFDDYKAAKIPVLPIKKGVIQTRIQMIIYIILFIFVSDLLTFFKYTGYTYLSVMTISGVYWLFLVLKRPENDNKIYWARKVFFVSILVLTIFCFLLIGNSFLP